MERNGKDDVFPVGVFVLGFLCMFSGSFVGEKLERRVAGERLERVRKRVSSCFCFFRG